MKRILSWSILIGFAVAQMAIIAPKFITSGSETMYMAVVGPMTGPDAERGKAMVDGATLMIDTLEKSGELGDRDIQLIIKDDKSETIHFLCGQFVVIGDRFFQLSDD